jgi:hypothetical protein
MMLFAFFLIIAGLGFILFGNYTFLPPENEKNNNSHKPPEKIVLNKLRNFGKERKSKITKEIKKRIFNKKYPEKPPVEEEEMRILKERELNFSPISKIEDEPRKTDLTNKNEINLNPNPENHPIIEDTSGIHYEDRKNPIFITGNLFVDFSKEIPLGDRNIKSIDWEENNFQHFRRMGNSKLFENNGNIEIKNESIQFRIVINEIEKVIFYENSVCILPSNSESPNLLFFSRDVNLLKVRLTEELRVL